MRAIAAVCLTLGLLTTGCSGAAEPSASPTRSASSSPSTSPTPPPSPSPSPSARPAEVPAPPRATNNRRGQTAFAKYVLQAWIYALNTNDPRPLQKVSGPKQCGGCGPLATELRKRKKQGWYVDLRDVRVGKAKITQSPSGETTLVELSVNIPESDTYFEDGSYRSTNDAHPRGRFTVEMDHAGKRFRLFAFKLS